MTRDQTHSTYATTVTTAELEEITPPAEQFEHLKVDRRFATSRDGTHVPYCTVNCHDTGMAAAHNHHVRVA